MPNVIVAGSASPDEEARLNAIGLSTELIHTSFGPGLSRANSRSSMALRSSPGTDIYHDTMEHLHAQLADDGWQLIYVDSQPRLLHPEGLVCITLAAAVNVANPDRRRQPRTGAKGKATRESLAAPVQQDSALFDLSEVTQAKELVAAAEAAPLWFLLNERTDRGLNLELSRPADMTPSGSVTDWDDRIFIQFLDLDGDFSAFDLPDNDGGIDVAVVPI